MSENARLETFCDGVFAIAITLLILEIKVPPVDTVHSITTLWIAIGRLWPSFFAFTLSFAVILISWVGHHSLFKAIDRSSPQFMYANGFFLLTIVILAFTTALMAEYMRTEYAQPAIVVYCFSMVIHNIGWNLLFDVALKPKNLAKNSDSENYILGGRKNSRYGFVLYSIMTILAYWFPYVALVITTLTWIFWIFVGINKKEERAK